jgi:hypothetical protein
MFFQQLMKSTVVYKSNIDSSNRKSNEFFSWIVYADLHIQLVYFLWN